MKKPSILKVQKDLSIPWYEQIKKTVLMPYELEHQIYYSIKPPDYVTALVVTVDKKVIILRQFRPAIEDYTYELPSGHLEKDETPDQAMIREIKEETGCIVEEVNLLGEIIPDTGRLENRLWAFYVNNVAAHRIKDPSENEGIDVILVSSEELIDMILSGKMNHALDLSVILLAVFRGYLKI